MCDIIIHMDNLFLRIVRQWMPLAVGISVIPLLIYLTIQQDIRIGANDPQIQMAEDLAVTLNSGKTATVSGQIDVAKSLAPFTIVYDKEGNLISSNASLNGKTPVVPQGVLDGSAKGENRVTWQPQAEVRLASVIVSYNKGYVLIGRNMREIEFREDQQFNNIILGWLITLAATLSCVYFMQTVMKGKK